MSKKKAEAADESGVNSTQVCGYLDLAATKGLRIYF